MSCNHPMMAIKGELQPSGKFKYKMVGAYTPDLYMHYPDAIPLPCGQCIGCRLDFAKAWADRMVLELDHSKKAVFVTCTYDDDHVPKVILDDTGECVLSLRKPDSAEFLKRIRNCFDGVELRFYANGEYGLKTQRPHIHYILFGIDLSDLGDLEFWSYNKFGGINWLCRKLMKYWKKGNVIVTDMTWETCAYVARYNLKKLKGTLNEEREFIEPEFSTMSRRPGIGMYFYKEHPECFEYSNIPVAGTHTLRKCSKLITIPKAFIKKLEDIDPELYNQLKVSRKQAAENIMFSRLAQTDLGYQDLKKMQKIKDEKSNEHLDIETQYIV